MRTLHLVEQHSIAGGDLALDIMGTLVTGYALLRSQAYVCESIQSSVVFAANRYAGANAAAVAAAAYPLSLIASGLVVYLGVKMIYDHAPGLQAEFDEKYNYYVNGIR